MCFLTDIVSLMSGIYLVYYGGMGTVNNLKFLTLFSFFSQIK